MGVGRVKEIVDGNENEVEIRDEREKWEVKIRGMKRKGDWVGEAKREKDRECGKSYKP